MRIVRTTPKPTGRHEVSGNLNSGFVFEGVVYRDSARNEPVCTGIFIVANRGGVHSFVNLETGIQYNDAYAIVTNDSSIELTTKL